MIRIRAARAVSEIVAIFKDGQQVESAGKGEKVEVATAVTPFLRRIGAARSATRAALSFEGGGDRQPVAFRVDDTRRPVAGMIVHVGQVGGGQVAMWGDEVTLVVDNGRRWDIRRNHTATHLLHRELRAHLGKHVTQAGSLVAPDRLRFDFTHDEAVDRQTLAQIETAINDAILANQPVTVTYMGQEEAIDKGAMALFGRKVRRHRAHDQNRRCGSGKGLQLRTMRRPARGRNGRNRLVPLRQRRGVGGRGAPRGSGDRPRPRSNWSPNGWNTLETVAHKLNAPLGELETRLDSPAGRTSRLCKRNWKSCSANRPAASLKRC